MLDQLRSIKRVRLYQFIDLLDLQAVREVKRIIKVMLADE